MNKAYVEAIKKVYLRALIIFSILAVVGFLGYQLGAVAFAHPQAAGVIVFLFIAAHVINLILGKEFREDVNYFENKERYAKMQTNIDAQKESTDVAINALTGDVTSDHGLPVVIASEPQMANKIVDSIHTVPDTMNLIQDTLYELHDEQYDEEEVIKAPKKKAKRKSKKPVKK